MKSKYFMVAATLGVLAQASWAAPEARVFTQITVVGNDRFRDEDILATSNLSEGQLIGQVELEQAVESLDFTGEFKSISISSQGDQLIITVEEQPEYTGNLSFGLGYDSDSGAIGVIDLSLRDLISTNFNVDARATFAQEFREAQVTFSYAEVAQNTDVGLRLSYAEYDYDDTLFDYTTAEVQPYLAYNIDEATAIELRYTFVSDDISNVDPAASSILQAEGGKADASLIGVAFQSAGRVDATSIDWMAKVQIDTTVSGDLSYTNASGSAGVHIPIATSGWALRSTIEAGAVRSKSGGGLPRASDRFSLGGSALRGFERSGVTVRDANGTTVTDIGGNTYATVRNEVIFPVLKERDEVDIFVFADFGSVWGIEADVSADGNLENEREWRTSSGVGASYQTQLGYFEGYYAITTEGTGTDEERAFGLTFRSDF